MAESKPAGSKDAETVASEDPASEMDNREIKALKPTVARDEVTQEDTPDVPLRQCEKKKVTINSWTSNHSGTMQSEYLDLTYFFPLDKIDRL